MCLPVLFLKYFDVFKYFSLEIDVACLKLLAFYRFINVKYRIYYITIPLIILLTYFHAFQKGKSSKKKKIQNI